MKEQKRNREECLLSLVILILHGLDNTHTQTPKEMHLNASKKCQCVLAHTQQQQ